MVSTAHNAPLLSLAMIVKNEAMQLRECLRSVHGIVDEIIVVDTGSGDETISIAKEEGATVFSYQWNDDFASARNYALEHCSGKWILQLDADERLRVKSSQEIRSLLKNDDVFGYALTIHSYVADNNTAVRSKAVRLFRRHPAIRYEGSVHEQVFPSIEKLGKKIIAVPLMIEHTGYADPEINQKKAERNAALLERHLQKHPSDPVSLFHYAMGLKSLQRKAEAKDVLRRLLELPDTLPSLVAMALNLAGQISNDEKNYEEALFYAQRSLLVVNSQFSARIVIAVASIGLKRYEQALQYLEEIRNMLASHGAETELLYDTTPSASGVWELIGACRAELGRYNEAFDAFLFSLETGSASEMVPEHIRRIIPLITVSEERKIRLKKYVHSTSHQTPLIGQVWIEFLCATGNYGEALKEASRFWVPHDALVASQLRWMVTRGEIEKALELLHAKEQ